MESHRYQNDNGTTSNTITMTSYTDCDEERERDYVGNTVD